VNNEERTAARTVLVPEAPSIPGLCFRKFSGPDDYPAMLAVIEGSKAADEVERADTLEDVARAYAHLTNCDPYQDMLFAEVDGRVIGYNRVFWEQQSDRTRLYNLFGFLLPAWRRKGIGTAMLRFAERRLQTIAARHPEDGPRFFQSWATDTERGALALLEKEGYRAVRHEFAMVRPLNEPIAPAPMPEGLTVRPIRDEQIRLVLAASEEAFRDHWGHVPMEEEDIQRWMADPTFNPGLWRVAWDGDQVAGMVLNFVNEEENKEYRRKRGYTEGICVRRPWRRRGLASALLTRSLRMFKAMGFEEAALGVDSQNLSGALGLYQGVGFRVVKRHLIYRKPLRPLDGG